MSKILVSKDGDEFTVHTHIILRNWWEYYLEEPDEDGIAFGYVMGVENEWGSVYLPEIKPYIISQTTNMDEVMPPDGFKWKDQVNEYIHS